MAKAKRKDDWAIVVYIATPLGLNLKIPEGYVLAKKSQGREQVYNRQTGHAAKPVMLPIIIRAMTYDGNPTEMMAEFTSVLKELFKAEQAMKISAYSAVLINITEDAIVDRSNGINQMPDLNLRQMDTSVLLSLKVI